MTIYTPEDEWPDHPKRWWRPVLDEARRRGWTLKRFTGHAWGSIWCPADECREPSICSSPKGSESFAKATLRKVKRCPHRSDEQTGAAADATDRLDAATRLANAAERLIQRDADRAQVEELLRLADAAVNPDVLEREFDEAVNAADVHEWEAKDLLADTPMRDADEPAPVLTQAEAEADAAEDPIGRLASEHEARRPLTQRRDDLMGRIRDLKVQAGLESADTT